MRHKTYRNVLRAAKIIQAKGYNFQEASEIAIKVFDEHESDTMPIEFYLGKVATKQEWAEFQTLIVR